MSQAGFIQEAEHHMTHVIAPNIQRSISGFYQVRVNKIKRKYVDLELRICDVENEKTVLYTYGRVRVRLRKAATHEQANSSVDLLPQELKNKLPMGANDKVDAWFQVFVVGISQALDVVELEFRLVEPDNKEIIILSMGTAKTPRKHTTTLHGLITTIINI